VRVIPVARPYPPLREAPKSADRREISCTSFLNPVTRRARHAVPLRDSYENLTFIVKSFRHGCLPDGRLRMALEVGCAKLIHFTGVLPL
jgi:hypothetical protein